MGMTNFLNNLFGTTEKDFARASGSSTSNGGINGPGGIGGNVSTYDSVSMIPGVPSVQFDTIYAAGGALHGRTPMNYSGGGWNIAGQIRPIQGGFGDLYSFRVHAPAIPSRLMGRNEIAYQIQRNVSSGDYTYASAPPVPTNGWLPPAMQIPVE